VKQFFLYRTKAVGLAAVLGITSTAYAAPDQGGDPADDSRADQTIKVSPSTKSVTVHRNETVKFIDTSTGQSFSWYFDTAQPVVDLSVGGHEVKAYVWDETGK
jgi:hypothetical protein